MVLTLTVYHLATYIIWASEKLIKITTFLLILLTAERKCLCIAIMWAIEHVKWKELNLLWLTIMPPKYPNPSVVWFKGKWICIKQWGGLSLNPWNCQE